MNSIFSKKKEREGGGGGRGGYAWAGYVENETTCGRVRLSLQNSWVLHESGLRFGLLKSGCLSV